MASYPRLGTEALAVGLVKDRPAQSGDEPSAGSWSLNSGVIRQPIRRCADVGASGPAFRDLLNRCCQPLEWPFNGPSRTPGQGD